MSDRRIEDLGDSLAVPRKNGELVFEAPWEGRVFGMAVAMSDDQLYAWDDFRDHLVAEIAAAEEHGDVSGYYERWLASFERLLLDSGVVTTKELDARTAEYAAGVYDEHEHYETTSDAIASLTRSPHTSGVRNIVWRADGEPINVFRRPRQRATNRSRPARWPTEPRSLRRRPSQGKGATAWQDQRSARLVAWRPLC